MRESPSTSGVTCASGEVIDTGCTAFAGGLEGVSGAGVCASEMQEATAIAAVAADVNSHWNSLELAIFPPIEGIEAKHLTDYQQKLDSFSDKSAMGIR